MQWRERLRLSRGLYLALMLGVIVVLTALIVPPLLWKKCNGCGARNALDAEVCKVCDKAFSDA